MASDLEIAAAAKAMVGLRNDLLSFPLQRVYERLAKAGLEAAERVRGCSLSDPPATASPQDGLQKITGTGEPVSVANQPISN